MQAQSNTYSEPEATSSNTELYLTLMQQFLSAGSTSAYFGFGKLMQLSSAQVPISAQPPVASSISYANTLLEVFPQIADNATSAPKVLNYANAFTPAKSVGEASEAFLYEYELEAVRESLHQRRGSDAQEKFMFDVVAPFIQNHGAKVLHDIDLTIEAMPRTAKYFFPYLLGHIEDESTHEARLALLERYSASQDEDVRDGAIEALGFLAAT